MNVFAVVVIWGAGAGLAVALVLHFASPALLRARMMVLFLKWGVRALIVGLLPMVYFAIRGPDIAAIAVGLIFTVPLVAGVMLTWLPLSRDRGAAKFRVRPLHVFVPIWLVCSIPTYIHFSDMTLEARAVPNTAVRVMGKITHAKSARGLSGNTYIDVEIPPTFGITRCSTTVGSEEIDPFKVRRVGILVSPDQTCHTASQLARDASRTPTRIIFLALLLGLMIGFMAYYCAVRIPFGWPLRSLKTRWAAERAA